MVVVGGPRSGDVVLVDPSRGGYTMVERPNVVPSGAETNERMLVHYSFRRVVACLPGRTDWQTFKTVARPRAVDGDVLGAVLRAWAAGWAPDDSTSEFWPHGPALAFSLGLARIPDRTVRG